MDQRLGLEDVSPLVVFIGAFVLTEFFLGDLNEMKVGELAIPSCRVDPLFEQQGSWLVLRSLMEGREHQLVHRKYGGALVLISSHLTVRKWASLGE